MKDFTNHAFLYEGGRAAYVYSNYLINHAYTHVRTPWTPRYVRVVSISKNNLVKWYFATQDENEFEITLQEYRKNKKLIQDVELYITKIRSETIQKIANTRFGILSDAELANLIAYFYQQVERLLFVPGTLREIDRASLLRLQNVFRDKTNVDKYVSGASVALELSFSSQEEVALLKLARRIVENNWTMTHPEVTNGLDKIFHSYTWSTCGYYDEPAKSYNDYKKQLACMISENPEERLNTIFAQQDKNKNEREKIISELSEEDTFIVHLVAESIRLKDGCKFTMNEIMHKSEPVFEEISSRTGFPQYILKNILPDEMDTLIRNRTLDEQMVRERIDHHVVVAYPGFCEVVSGRRAREFEKKYIAFGASEKKEFHGRIASRGLAKGSAKVVLESRDFTKLEEGDILITTNTSPDFVPIMRKAAGIVAEEGGLTAHVSVVSREFGIPCVVKIDNITQIVKDGDLVEVDANEGTIRIVD